MSCALLSFLHSSAVGVGFYGNSETNDGVYQLTDSLYNANHTLGGINNLVGRDTHAKSLLQCICPPFSPVANRFMS